MLSSNPIPKWMQKYLGEPDPRVKDWFLLNSPLNLLAVYSLYSFVLICGSKIMKNRKPLQLQAILIVYNCFQIALSTYICKELWTSAYLSGHNIVCTPLDKSESKLALRLARAFWLYYISKAIDLIDTVFFVLRKKESQLTFLHVYHHTSMLYNWYIGVLYVPGGQATVSVGINSFVHIIMYTYYLLSAMGPKVQKYLWWKKYLTQMQMIQFILLIVHLAIGYTRGCHKPGWLVVFTIFYLVSMVYLFLKYYMHMYITINGRKDATTRKLYLKAGGDAKNTLKAE